MIQLCRQTMVAAALAVLGSVSSSAWADSYTIDFKTFFNTATADNFDTKTLNFSVAKLTISDLAGGNGVQLALTHNNHTFAALSSECRQLCGRLVAQGAQSVLHPVQSVKCASLAAGAGTYSATPFIKDVGYAYNWNVDFSGASFAEGQSAVLTLTGAGLSAATLTTIAQQTPIMLTLGNVGSTYGLASMGNTVNFVGGPPMLVTAVPEPATYALMGLGLVGLVWARRRHVA
jgi:hypothetical protein